MPNWFRNLHPTVQGIIVVCGFTLLIIVIFNREASTNIVNVLPYFMYLTKGNGTEEQNKPKE